jgi:hypothetical protein
MFRNIRRDSYRVQSSNLIVPYELQPSMSIAMLQEPLAKGAVKSLDPSDHASPHRVDFGGE